MRTREEAKTLLGDAYSKKNCNCIDKGLCTHQSDAFASVRAFNQAYDSFQQHIKSLEAQLANTEQLTCDGCIYFNVLTVDGVISCGVFGEIRSEIGFEYTISADRSGFVLTDMGEVR